MNLMLKNSPMNQKVKRAMSLLIVFFFTLSMAIAQVLVRGTVLDATGESIPGASIQVKGTTIGTISDMDGKFSLSAPNKNATIVISFIGYTTKEIKVVPQKPMTIVLQEDTKILDEVVVVGYQEVKKRDLTGSVARVDMDNLLKTPNASFDQALGGKIAGVNITSGDGSPGSTMNIVIRGNNSLTQGNSPLYVIDGFPVEDPAVAATINPNDIESIDVLKDASSTAIYGARGANGVVMISTKKGKVGKAQITYDGSIGMQSVTNKLKMLDGYEFVKLQSEIFPTEMSSTYLQNYDGKQWTLDDYRTAPSVDWQDEIFRTAWQQNHNVRIMGGSEDIRYNASTSYFQQDGILLNSAFNRFQARANAIFKRNKLTVNLTTNFSRSVQSGTNPAATASSGMNNLFFSVWGYRPVTTPDKNIYDLIEYGIDPNQDVNNDYRYNPILSLKNDYRKNYINNLQLNGYAEYEFIKGLKLKISGGWTYDARATDVFNNSNSRYGNPRLQSNGVNGEIARSQRITWLNENLLTWQTNIKKKHFFTTLAGLTLQNSDAEVYGFKAVKLPNESLGLAGLQDGTLNNATSALSSWSMMSYLAKFDYNYNSKYYANVSFRADGSSKFSKKNRFGYFPSASLAWSFTEESFLKPAKKWLNSGKLRTSWGLTGNNRVGEYDRYAIMAVDEGSGAMYPFNNNLDNKSVTVVSLANNDLKWETTEQYNVGVDLGLLGDRIGLTMDWYYKITRDLLLEAELPISSGFASATKNIGKISNTGIELTLNTQNIKKKNFTWNTNFNISFNRNKVLSLAEGQQSLLRVAPFDSNNFKSSYSHISMVGMQMGLLYGYVYEGTYKYDSFNENNGVYTLKSTEPVPFSMSTVQPGMPKFKDVNRDGFVTVDDRTIVGSTLPKHTGGFTNDFTYKNFDLSIFFQWSYGNDVLNANKIYFESGINKMRDLNQFASYANRWTPENPTSDIPSAATTSTILAKQISSRLVEDGSFLRLKTVSLGYTFPKKMLGKSGLTKARLYLAAQNLYTWTKYSGYDPEVSIYSSALIPGVDFSSYPRAFAVNFGVNLGF